jgi:hypothetical protein
MARGDITPPVGIYHRMWGAAVHDRATSVHRRLLATALWIANKQGEAARLIVALDHCLFDDAEFILLRRAAAQAIAIESEQVHICLSHTHGAGLMSRSRENLPGGEMIGPYLDRLAQQVAELAAIAKHSAAPATMVYGTGRCSLAAHRDYFDVERRQFVCGFNPDGPADDTLLVARITRDEDDRALATLVNYACHPTTLAWDNTAISPDWIGAMREVVEGATQAPCLFLQGASGDLGPREGFVGEHAVADRNGRQVGYAALAALEGLPPPGKEYRYAGAVLSGAWIGTWQYQPMDEGEESTHAVWQWRRVVVELPYRADLPTLEETRVALAQHQAEEEAARAAGDADRARAARASIEQMTRQIGRLEQLPPGDAYPLAITVGRLGDALCVFSPGELYQVFQTSLRARFAPRPVIVTTISDGWLPGYLPAAASYGQGIYQDIISPLAPGCLERLLEATARELAML